MCLSKAYTTLPFLLALKVLLDWTLLFCSSRRTRLTSLGLYFCGALLPLLVTENHSRIMLEAGRRRRGWGAPGPPSGPRQWPLWAVQRGETCPFPGTAGCGARDRQIAAASDGSLSKTRGGSRAVSFLRHIWNDRQPQETTSLPSALRPGYPERRRGDLPESQVSVHAHPQNNKRGGDARRIWT